ADLAGEPLRQRGYALHAAHVAREIAEGLAPATQDRKRPLRLGRDVDDVAELDLGRHRHAVPDVAVALAEYLQVDGKHQRAALGGGSALDQSADEAAILHHVELEPERLAYRLGHVLDRADRHGGERERNARRLGRAARQDL